MFDFISKILKIIKKVINSKYGYIVFIIIIFLFALDFYTHFDIKNEYENNFKEYINHCNSEFSAKFGNTLDVKYYSNYSPDNTEIGKELKIKVIKTDNEELHNVLYITPYQYKEKGLHPYLLINDYRYFFEYEKCTNYN